MTTAPSTPHVRLNRAFVQSKVIQSNLQHLNVILSAEDVRLRDDLMAITDRFGQYVHMLNDACSVADREQALAASGRV